MGFKFNITQKEDLTAFWKELDGLDKQTNLFIQTLSLFRKHVPELVTGKNEKIETKERKAYLELTKCCDKLLNELSKIPELDRQNRLAPA